MLKTTSGEQTRYRALTRPFSLSEAEYAEMGVACETSVNQYAVHTNGRSHSRLAHTLLT